MRPRHECLGVSRKTGLDVVQHRWSATGVCLNRGCGISRKEVRAELREQEREAKRVFGLPHRTPSESSQTQEGT